MNNSFEIKMYSFTLDCKEPYELAKFYSELLNWEIYFHDEEYTIVGQSGIAQGACPGITFQKNIDYKPPVWPTVEYSQQQMAHIDFAVNDLDKAVKHAINCGAIETKKQFSNDWRVMLDPAGHPFCLCLIKQIFAMNE